MQLKILKENPLEIKFSQESVSGTYVLKLRYDFDAEELKKLDSYMLLPFGLSGEKREDMPVPQTMFDKASKITYAIAMRRVKKLHQEQQQLNLPF